MNDNKVFTVGIGEDPDQYFLENAAHAGKGTQINIMNAKVDKLKQMVKTQLQKAVDPVLEDCSFAFGQNLEFDESDANARDPYSLMPYFSQTYTLGDIRKD